MATMKMQTPNETQIHESKKTLETPPLQPSLTERLEESAIPSTGTSDIATDATKKEGEEPEEMGSEKEKAEDTILSAGAAASPVSDLDKKMRRAERFGISVQMSEEEKRNSRAERFGTVSSPHGSNASQKSEEQKRKARAERFGLPSESLADEESKKKARLARFATVPKMDNLEEEKKKARAIRFSQPPSGASAQINGSSNSEQKRAVEGENHVAT